MKFFKSLAPVVSLMMMPLTLQAQEPLVVTVVTKGAFTEAAKKIIGEAYKRINTPVEFKTFPSERALISTNLGRTDGELYRIDKMKSNPKYPNLIQVPVSYIPDEAAAFSKLDIKSDGWKSLEPYKIAIRVGNKFVESNAKGMKVSFVNTDLQKFQMLEKDRVDVVIASRWDGLGLIKQIGSKTIKPLEPNIVTNPLFHYMNVKHKDKAKQLGLALQEMHDDGTIKRILDEAKP